jgi:hypothetical protein
MKRQYRSIISWLRAAIKNEDTVTAVEVAKQLLPLLGQLRIEAEPPVFYYRDDKDAILLFRYSAIPQPLCEWLPRDLGQCAIPPRISHRAQDRPLELVRSSLQGARRPVYL